jgi:hypothetical protein
MKQDDRSIVRKRPQELLYLELGRENGCIMLNLSQDGCGFQAISPVTLGKTRFAFQISGGRRIAGDAEVHWVDEPGITGGLQFLDLEAGVREQIRMWLNDTNSPEEPGEVRPKETRRHSWPDNNSERVMEEPEIPLPSAHMPTTAPPLTLEDVRSRFPLLRGDDSYRSSRGSFTAMRRGLVRLAVVVTAGALLYMYRLEVANTLISLGETITRYKATAVAPESKPPRTGRSLSLPKILSGMNSFEINEIQEEETGAAITRRLECNKLHWPRKVRDGIFAYPGAYGRSEGDYLHRTP